MTAIDWAASGRLDEYSFHLVDPATLVETGETVDVLDGGTLTYATAAENRIAGKLTLSNATTDRMVRVKHVITLPGGFQFGETLATLYVDGDSADARYRHVSRDTSLYSPLLHVTQDVAPSDFSRPAGTNILGEIRDLVGDGGGKVRALPGLDEDMKHTVPVWWEVGTSKAEILSDLALWCGCELGVDVEGYITWGPYTPPSKRPISYVFDDGDACVYTSGYSLDHAVGDSCNRVVAHFARQSKQDDPSKENYDPFPLSDSTFVDLPASHPYSYERLGRRKSYDLKVNDPCDHKSLAAMAQRKLDELSRSDPVIVIEHASVPGLREGCVVQYVNGTDPHMADVYSVLAVVEEISMTMGPGCMCKTKLRCI